MDQSTVVDRDRAGRAHQVIDGVERDTTELPLRDAADPVAIFIVLVVEVAFVAAGNYRQWPLVLVDVVEIGADG